jgi:hypothetical protein
MRKIFVFVLLLTVMCPSAILAVEMKRMEEKAPAAAVPGAEEAVKIETLTLDVSCFLDEEPVAAEVQISQIDAGGNKIHDTSESNWSEDGRVRFSVIKGRNYRVSAEEKESPGGLAGWDVERASQDLNNISHSTAIGLALMAREPQGGYENWPGITMPSNERIVAPPRTSTTSTTTTTLRPMGAPLKRL